MARQAERRSRFAWRLASAGIVVFLIVSGFAATQPQPASEDWKVFDRPGKFITALCATGEALWIGTEDRGLWRLDLSADPAKPDAWKQFIGKDGPSTEHVYAIAVDSAGRVWVGTANQGVAVYNGVEWRTFGVLDGCAGERVFAIAADADRRRGHVWICTDHGLACWSPDAPGGTGGSPASAAVGASNSQSAIPGRRGDQNLQSLAPGTWRTYTRADGLPSDQIYALAVDKRGRVWVGTECDGLAWSDPPYKKWTCVRAAAERSGDSGEAPGLNGGTGPGLPSNLSNDLLVLRDGTVVYSTNYGLGMGRGGGLTWKSWQGLSKQPYQNYCRGLAEDPSGRLWIATRHLGLARLDGRTGKLKSYRRAWRPVAKPGEPPKVPPSLPDDYVFDVAVTADGDVWAGTYGGGLARLKGAAPAAKSAGSRSVVSAKPPFDHAQGPEALEGQSFPSLPAPAAPPTLEELNAMLAQLSKVLFVPPEKQPAVIRLDDDWLTGGNWLDRYGRQGAILCAMGGGGNDFCWGYRGSTWSYRAWIGGASGKDDGLRYWVHWMTSDKPQVLQNPILGGRKQSEWDDHGEVFPMSMDGPHIYCTVRIPEGAFRLSLYFFNKDGESGSNRFRDYRVTLKETPMTQEVFSRISTRDPEAERYFQSRPELARARVRDFRSGVYKAFYVRGPNTYTIRILRNHSFNTICSAVMIDPIGPLRPRIPPSSVPPKTNPQVTTAALDAKAQPGPMVDRCAAAVLLWDHLQNLMTSNPCWFATKSRGIWLRLMSELRREAVEEGQFGNRGANRRLADGFEALCMFSDRDRLDDRRGYHWNLWFGKALYGTHWPQTAQERKDLRRGEPLKEAKAGGIDQP